MIDILYTIALVAGVSALSSWLIVKLLVSRPLAIIIECPRHDRRPN